MDYISEFIKCIRKSPDFKRQIKAFEPMLGKASWDFIPLKKSALQKEKRLSVILKKARQTDLLHFGTGKKRGLCLSLKLGNQIYGFLIGRGLKAQIPKTVLSIFRSSMETLLREIQKELELKKVYETMGMRTIALSTIHTVHRLVSTTPDAEDLLPKIARLCLQMMRSKQCTIIMLDQSKRLVVRAAVDDRKSLRTSHKPFKPKGVEARIVKTAASVMSAKRLIVPLVDEDVIGMIKVTEKMGGKAFSQFDKEILSTFAEQAVIAFKNTQLYEEQKRMIFGSIKSLTAILDTQGPYDYKPSGVFVRLVQELAIELKVSQEDIDIIQYATSLHDAGKVGVPDWILKKPKKLTGKEYSIIKAHPEKGVEILKPLDALKPAIPLIMSHHERYDGQGYPKGLKGKQIPIGARIMAVADAFVAMLSKRPYRPAMSPSKAVSEIARNSGKQFDPHVVNAFLKLVKSGRLKKILKNKKGLSKNAVK